MENQINKEEIKHLAKLSNLYLDEQHLSEFDKQIKDIVALAATMEAVDTSDVEPMYTNSDEVNKTRKDEAHLSQTREELFKNAPRKLDDFIVVPEKTNKEVTD